MRKLKQQSQSLCAISSATTRQSEISVKRKIQTAHSNLEKDSLNENMKIRNNNYAISHDKSTAKSDLKGKLKTYDLLNDETRSISRNIHPRNIQNKRELRSELETQDKHNIKQPIKKEMYSNCILNSKSEIIKSERNQNVSRTQDSIENINRFSLDTKETTNLSRLKYDRSNENLKDGENEHEKSVTSNVNLIKHNHYFNESSNEIMQVNKISDLEGILNLNEVTFNEEKQEIKVNSLNFNSLEDTFNRNKIATPDKVVPTNNKFEKNRNSMLHYSSNDKLLTKHERNQKKTKNSKSRIIVFKFDLTC